MEERKLNEKESLELITQMIQNTKDRKARLGKLFCRSTNKHNSVQHPS